MDFIKVADEIENGKIANKLSKTFVYLIEILAWVWVVLEYRISMTSLDFVRSISHVCMLKFCLLNSGKTIVIYGWNFKNYQSCNASLFSLQSSHWFERHFNSALQTRCRHARVVLNTRKMIPRRSNMVRFLKLCKFLPIIKISAILYWNRFPFTYLSGKFCLKTSFVCRFSRGTNKDLPELVFVCTPFLPI